MDVQWPFGTGLSYTTFEYSDLKASVEKFTSSDVLDFTFTVRNSGNATGKETMLLYSSDLVASVVPDIRRLRAFAKIELQPGESQQVTLSVPAKDLAFVNTEGAWTLEKGQFVFTVGGQNIMLECTEDKVWDSQNIR